MSGWYLEHESELLVGQNGVGVGLPVGRLQERRRKEPKASVIFVTRKERGWEEAKTMQSYSQEVGR